MNIEQELEAAKKRLAQLEELLRIREKLVGAEMRLLGATEAAVICEIVCAYYRQGMTAIRFKDRRESTVWLRFMTMRLMREFTNLSLSSMCEYFTPAVTDHGSILHGVRRAKERAEVDPKFRGEYEELTRIIALKFKGELQEGAA